MKKFLIIVGMLLILNFVIVATNTPNISVSNKDINTINKTVAALPINDAGNFEPGKLAPFKTKADERINSINQWLDDNVSWMRFIFNMKPQISFLFVINLYFILFFFTILVINSRKLWFFIEAPVISAFFGLAVFVILLVSKLYIGLAKIVYLWGDYLITVLFPSYILLSIVLGLATIILILISLPLVEKLISLIYEYTEAKEKFKEKSKIVANSESINKFVDQIVKK